MGITVFSRWASHIEDRDDSGVAIFRFGDNALKDFEELRVKSTKFLKDILTRSEDEPYINPMVSVYYAHKDYDASYYRTGEFTFSADLQDNYPDLFTDWDNLQFIVLQDTDPLANTLHEMVERHCIVMETDDERVQFLPVTDSGFQTIALEAVDPNVYGGMSPAFVFTAKWCEVFSIPHLFTTK